MWICDTATHFKNGLVIMLLEALVVKRYNKEVVYTVNTIPRETGRKANTWVQVVPMVLWALNLSSVELRLLSCFALSPIQVGRTEG